MFLTALVAYLASCVLGAWRTYGIESENAATRGQIFDDSLADSCSIGQEPAEIWTAQTVLQPILHKPDRLLPGASGVLISVPTEPGGDPPGSPFF